MYSVERPVEVISVSISPEEGSSAMTDPTLFFISSSPNICKGRSMEVTMFFPGTAALS